MPLFSKRKSGKQKSKVGKHGQESSKAQANSSQKLKHQDVGAKQNFNGVKTTPDIPRKELLTSGKRPQNSTAKCVANFPRRSRLSKSLPEVLVDNSILPLLLEFLQRQGAQNVLNFWLAAETFRLSSRDKNLFPYKSRLNPKLTSNMAMCSIGAQNDSMYGIPVFQIERNEQSSEINLAQHKTSQNPNSSTTNDECGGFKSENSGLRTEDITPTNFSGSPWDTSNVSHHRTASENFSENATILTSQDRTIENNSLYDSTSKNTSADFSGSPLVYNSTDSNISLGSRDEDFSTTCSISPIGAGQYSTNLSVSSMLSDSPVSIVNSPEEGNNSDIISSTVSDNESLNSECSELFRTEQQLKIDGVSGSVGKSQRDESDAEMFQPQKKDELLRQESNDRRERRRMSKIMLDDALSIYRHFISLDASQPLGVDENIRREVESKICTENGLIDPDCFNIAQKFAFSTLQDRYYDDFIRSSYYQKHVMDILTSGKVFLADVMYNDSSMFYFMEFMEQEEKSYLLAFWFAVDSFCQELESKLNKKEYNSDEALDDAMVLYDKYFSMQASNSLGVSDETRIGIENKICREGGPLPECFEEPMENVLTLLEEVYFPIFLDSSVYFKYLNELFSSVTDVESDQISSYADDCSSTASGSETSKLMEALVNDVEAHEDPDEIWQRPQFGLSIGRVNEFGIYEPGIEPQPGGKEALKFGQKMRKLVSGDSEKVKEEMAWKVAKMVLEDVKKQQGKKPKSR